VTDLGDALRALVAKMRDGRSRRRRQPRLNVGEFVGARKVDEWADELAAILATLVGREEACGVIGKPDPEKGEKVCELPRGHDGYHKNGNWRWLGYWVDPPQETTR
jgi:hypothetical protein